MKQIFNSVLSFPAFFAKKIFCLFIFSSVIFSISSVNAQNNQLVPAAVCELAADTSQCFPMVSQTYTVGKEVSLLSDLYKFCMQVYSDSTVTDHSSRIILTLDCSGSMCSGADSNAANDPTDMRIAAANNFVDSVAANCPLCQIGVVEYIGGNSAGFIETKFEARTLNAAANITAIHAAINQGACSKHSASNVHTPSGTTYTGIPLDTAVHMIDRNAAYKDIYDSITKANMKRHIILMTDGDWNGPTPATIYTEYQTNHPGRPIPIIHGIFIQATTNTTQYNLSFLDSATKLCRRNTPPDTAMYFSGTSAATIVATFDTLFKRIVVIDTVSVGLASVIFTDLATQESRTATVIKNSSAINDYTIKIPQFALSYGTNTFKITLQVTDTAGVQQIQYDTLTIIRNTTSGSGNVTVFKDTCLIDTMPLSITCSPDSLIIPQYTTVTAKVDPKDSIRFAPNNIMLRAFVPFTDNDAQSIALFHLDNNLLNTAPAGVTATGTPVFSRVNAAFGSSISSGTFQTVLPMSISATSDFTIECWIKPSANQAAAIVTGSGITFSITADNYLSATIGSTAIKTTHVIDDSVWQHVAIARSSGSANIYINGIPMASSTAASGVITGTLTVGPVTSGLLDEFRISIAVRSVQIQEKTVLTIPTASQILWNVDGVASAGATAWLPYSLWQGSPKGQARFGFSSTVDRQMIINFFDTASSPVSLMWSKNGDPVIFKLNLVTDMTLKVTDSCIKAGDSTTVTATLYRGSDIVTSTLKDSVYWKLDSATSKAGDRISKTMGQAITVTGTVAYRYINVIASFTDPLNNKLFIDTASVCVLPDVSYRVVIVGAGDTIMTISNKNTMYPINLITMDSATDYDTVYAVTYDAYGNWTGKADNAVWTSLDTSAVNAAGVLNKNFTGVIIRNTRNLDSAYVVASQTGLVPDSVLVILQNGTITAIRLVDINGNVVNSVNMTTDDTAFLQIQVKWSSDTSTWVNGAGSWTLSFDSITWIRNPPVGTQTGSWTLDPVTAGSDSLTVNAGNQTLTIPVTITVADPNKVTLTILTPADSLIAGDTILVEVRIQNTDGLVQGSWCKGSEAYSDIFKSKKGPEWIPNATITGTPSVLILGSTIGQECFVNGLDTIKVVLYDAPYTQDTLHQLWILLTSGGGRVLRDSTDPFVLLPGPLDSISIEDANFKAIPGPVTLTYPNDMRFFFSSGYDHYRNLIGHTNTTWTRDGTLHPIDPPNENIFRVYYEAVDNDEQGYIITQATSGVDISITLYDSVEVIIKASIAVLDSAITRDENGNGYLDHIYVYFNKSVEIPSTYLMSNVTVRYNVYNFVVDSVNALDTTSKTLILYLRDTVKAGNGVITTNFPSPQTAWRPSLTMKNLPDSVNVINFKCKDGAGPVIWRVVVNRSDATDRTKDEVVVMFSEPFKSGKTGDKFQPSTLPYLTFAVWKKVNNVFSKVDNVLFGIPNFISIGDSIAIFDMTNSQELFDYNYFNIISDSVSSYVSDKANTGLSNLPNIDNQKVLVEIVGDAGQFTVGPNPLIPTVTYTTSNGLIAFVNNTEAVTWVKNSGGTVIRISIAYGSSTTIKGYLKIYDVVGNLVNYGESGSNMMDEISAGSAAPPSNVYYYDIYWNGLNSKGMKAAPGGYLAVMYLKITKQGESSKSRKQVCKIGIAR